MDTTTLVQIIIDVLLAIAAFFGGWILNRITTTMDKLDDDIRLMPDKYVSKSDYHRDIDEIKGMLGKIFDELRAK